jgi:hypothetical protein
VKHSPKSAPERKPPGLTDDQLVTVLAHGRLVAPRYQRRFFQSFMNHLSRSVIQSGRGPTHTQVQDACRYAITGSELSPTEPPCGFDSSQEGPPGPPPIAHTRDGTAHA